MDDLSIGVILPKCLHGALKALLEPVNNGQSRRSFPAIAATSVQVPNAAGHPRRGNRSKRAERFQYNGLLTAL